MTDLEMTRLCAEAMGYRAIVCLDEHRLRCHRDPEKGESAGNIIYFCPLRDDAQALELVKAMSVGIGRGNGYFVVEHWYSPPGAERYEVAEAPMCVIRCSSPNLNRAIVECVAKMQAAKK